MRNGGVAVIKLSPSLTLWDVKRVMGWHASDLLCTRPFQALDNMAKVYHVVQHYDVIHLSRNKLVE